MTGWGCPTVSTKVPGYLRDFNGLSSGVLSCPPYCHEWHSRGRRFDPAWLHQISLRINARGPVHARTWWWSDRLGCRSLQTAIGLDIRLVAVAIGPIAVIAVIARTIIATAGAAIGAAPTADRLNR